MIRRDVSKSQKIASLSKESTILFLMIIPHLNSFGKLNGSPHFIKGEVVPLLEYFDIKLIEKCLKEITEKTNVKWFKVAGLHYLQSINWEEHQDLRESRRGHDELPDFIRQSDNSIDIMEKSGSSPGQVRPEVKVEVEVEVKGKVEGENGCIPYLEIITDLNEKTGKHYRDTRDNKSMIQARWKDGFRLEDFQQVHLKMSARWKDDPKMNQYLRPSTLYAATKFEGYLNQQDIKNKFHGATHGAAALQMIDELRKQKEQNENV